MRCWPLVIALSLLFVSCAARPEPETTFGVVVQGQVSGADAVRIEVLQPGGAMQSFELPAFAGRFDSVIRVPTLRGLDVRVAATRRGEVLASGDGRVSVPRGVGERPSITLNSSQGERAGQAFFSTYRFMVERIDRGDSVRFLARVIDVEGRALPISERDVSWFPDELPFPHERRPCGPLDEDGRIVACLELTPPGLPRNARTACHRYGQCVADGWMRPEPADFADVAAGGTHSCRIRNDGTVSCWGGNDLGQLGSGMTGLDTPTPTAVAGLANVRGISAGLNKTTCVVTATNSVLCWGANAFGELGSGGGNPSATPVSVAVADIVRVSAGRAHACAITMGYWPSSVFPGAAYCWGDNQFGQLGVGDIASRSAPVQVLHSDLPALIAAGGRHACMAATVPSYSNGVVECWGTGPGTGFATPSPSPRFVRVVHAKALDAGEASTCVINDGEYSDTNPGYVLVDMAVRCWGANERGELGDGTTVTRLTPAPVIGLQGLPTHLAVGGSHACAIVDGGSVFCWGDNTQGQLGGGGPIQGCGADLTGPPCSTTAVLVSGADRAVRIAAGAAHTCILRTDNTFHCWGANGSRQLGL